MYYIGVDLGGTNIAVGIVDENYKIIGKKSVKTFNNRPFTEIVHDMAVCIKDLISSYNISEDEIVSVGIGAPGSLDTEKDVYKRQVWFTSELKFLVPTDREYQISGNNADGFIITAKN